MNKLKSTKFTLNFWREPGFASGLREITQILHSFKKVLNEYATCPISIKRKMSPEELTRSKFIKIKKNLWDKFRRKISRKGTVDPTPDL